MLSFFIAGFDYRRADSQLRSRLFLEEQQLNSIKEKLQDNGMIILQTCNRSTFFSSKNISKDQFLKTFSEIKNYPKEILEGVFEFHYSVSALRYLFRLASSLESMVVGEAQILGQLKDAYKASHEQIPSDLDQYFQAAFRSAKKVRSESDIGKNKISIPSIAFELSKTVCGPVKSVKAVLVGYGKIGMLTAKYFVNSGVKELIVTSRSKKDLSALGHSERVNFLELEYLTQLLEQCDVAIFATSSKKHLFDHKLAQYISNKRSGRPLFTIDMGIPQNVASNVNEIDGIYSYNIDDFEQIAQNHKSERLEEIKHASRLVDEDVKFTLSQLSKKQQKENVKALRDYFLEDLDTEIDSLMGEEIKAHEAEIKILIRKIMEKKIHGPTINIKEISSNSESQNELLSKIIQHLFSKK